MPDTPEKAVHPANPSSVDEWAKMSDAKDFYVIVHGLVGHAQTTRLYEVSGEYGDAVKPVETEIGNGIAEGTIVSAKTFGPGVNIQRLINLGAIRPATEWETEVVSAELNPPTESGVTPAPIPVAPVAHVEPKAPEPVKPVEPTKVETAKVEHPKVEPAKPVVQAPSPSPDKK